ncbi:hypothetical protein P691DRAFT_796657 [Macrolepiota fuliginosa MF-IS2]|uniref:Uncharacterized protein n=1 Tax=Macrolepiota fuliginosa MF-IS2 TaxID=1400762 RepID=A0A9P5X3T2_9AGAR|nr:hypothetical protein P691DRAFT_796657 [Macrolepiota fuliginosa MF-IS2]
MTNIVSEISVAQAATTINAAIAFVQLTISLSLVILLIYFIPKTNTAITWSLISKISHSSLWPAILRADSSSGKISGAVVSTVSRLTLVTTILVTVAGILLPLGLGDGPLVPADSRPTNAQYIPDNSPLASSTTRNRAQFAYGRFCSLSDSGPPTPCPGNHDPNTTAIAPPLIEIFNSTPHGPFTVQYRWFHTSFILRNDTFVTEGVIVDMSPTHPGIGFWNQTLPKLINGGTWSQDLLWLEPVTECIDTNLTFDYFMVEGGIKSHFESINISDYGGFVDLAPTDPIINDNGQDVDLIQHAYKGAVLSNAYTMPALNATRQSSFVGASYPLADRHQGNVTYFNTVGAQVDTVNPIPISYFNYNTTQSISDSCKGYGSSATANITNVNVECGIFLGPPQRTDNGDPRDYDPGSRWSQKIHSCASTTRASIQTVGFSTNGTTDLQSLHVTRTLGSLNVLWATEKTNLTIAGLTILWGQVDDRYENDTSLWTLRADGLYLPASYIDTSLYSPGVLLPGLPQAGHAAIWAQIYQPLDAFAASYSGGFDFVTRLKFQSLVAQDPEHGNAQIRNLVWTDKMANNFIGTQTNDTLLVAEYMKSIQYDFRFAIPGFILLSIWVPSFLGAIFLFITRSLTFEYMKKMLNHTSVGRVVVGASSLRIRGQDDDQPNFARFDPYPPFVDLGRPQKTDGWGSTTPVTLELGHKGGRYEDRDSLLEPLNRR